MTPKIAAGVGMVFMVSAIVVLLVSVFLSFYAAPSRGLSVMGTVLLALGIALRVRSRKLGAG
ncbi:hypothetical protein GCM10011529_10730 [Polymorphobacter glacialis]|uniref:Uncharacterized protein n=1 Tax=Sandarakinorhabdus glacialis TaxID=1614636 RepID=A0A916ZPT3_9SPHN|nr:hypothetical protein [Polymorphobacter glacialis]GGE06203.1 hypothetical protein GCM10011529_10730 [Polymorphobacter glacialis]